MKRALFGLLPLVLAAAACKTAGPAAGPRAAAAADPLRPYVGSVRLLRHDAEDRRIKLDARKRSAERCTVVTAVRAASLDKDSARFVLETLGFPRLDNKRTDCRRMQPELQLVITGLPSSAGPAELTARIDDVLQTPEAYLAARAVRFDLPAGKPPAGEVASREAAATAAEAALGRRITAWPQPLLSSDVWCRDPSGRVRQEGEIEVDAIVGSDGRLHRPLVKTSLNDAHASAVLRSLSLWRFRPAVRPDGPAAARVVLRPVLHIY